ncbi:hypothetical protein Leryth_026384 [Lithospermum erythrorhizon]|nr:hypothetical protein Leryth_026384 [Lithospermum erythrorhizon]
MVASNFTEPFVDGSVKYLIKFRENRSAMAQDANITHSSSFCRTNTPKVVGRKGQVRGAWAAAWSLWRALVSMLGLVGVLDSRTGILW